MISGGQRWRGRVMVVLAWGALAGGCGGGTSGSPADANGDSRVSGVSGTLTLPGTATGRPYFVRLFTMDGRASLTATAETSGMTTGATSLPYAIATVPAGTYFILGFVDVDASGGTASTPGDYAGWYGHSGDGNPPAAATAVVPASGTATFDFALVLR